jgi:ABC-type multidrug transport system fused ATPase/permease subunit
MGLKSKFSDLGPLVLQVTGGHEEGGHFAPVYNLFNIVVSAVSLHPGFFHLVVILCYVLTAYVIFRIAQLYYRDNWLGILAGTLFLINYYVSFRSLTWNCFHSHATNTLTGTISLYYLLQYFENKKTWALGVSTLCLALTIFNYESGFVFLPVLGTVSLYYLVQKKISWRKFIGLVLLAGLIAALFSLGARFSMGKSMPLSYRFQSSSEKWSRNIQNYALQANELLFKSIGMSFPYNKLVFNNLKSDSELKEKMIRLLRKNDKTVLKEIPLATILVFVVLAVMTLVGAVFLWVLIYTRIRPETRLFLIIFVFLYVITIFVFYRSDVANAIAVFSSLILADFVLSLLRDPRPHWVKLGQGILIVYTIVTLGTILDRFDDCYRTSYTGLQKVALLGPQRIYDQINQKMGRFANEGFILFIHDYKAFERTTDERRIGLLLNTTDFISYNATVFAEDFLKTDWVERFRYKSFLEFSKGLDIDPRYQKIIVSSRDAALTSLKEKNVDLKKIEAFYISPDYRVERLNELVLH